MGEAHDGGIDYQAVLERARRAAAQKRASGEVPDGTGAALDRLFLEVAPGGARAAGDGLEAAVEMLGRYRFDPAVPVQSPPGWRGRLTGLVKHALQPVTAWQLRHLTDQLNAYHLAEIELLRRLVDEREGTGPAPPES